MLVSRAFAPRTLALAVAALLAVSACGGSAAGSDRCSRAMAA